MRVIAPKNLTFKLILVIRLIFSWLYLLSGAYYFGDDFFFLGIPRSPDVISFLFSPIYTHLMPGTKAIYIVLSTISFPSYIGAKVFYVLMALMYAYSIAVVLKYMGMRELIRGLLGASCYKHSKSYSSRMDFNRCSNVPSWRHPAACAWYFWGIHRKNLLGS